MQVSFSSVVDLAKLLSDETRVKILALLVEHEDGMCVYEISDAVGASQSATSHQLAKLESKGVVLCFRDGQKMCYELADTKISTSVRRALHTLSV